MLRNIRNSSIFIGKEQKTSGVCQVFRPIDDQDITILREHILLPILLTVFEHDKKKILQGGIKITRPYIAVIDAAMDRVTKDMVAIRKEINKRGIKIVKEQGDSYSIQYEFVCRGLHQVFAMPREFIKAETEVRMTKYLQK